MDKPIQLRDEDLRRSVSVLASDLNMNIFYTELAIDGLTIISFLSSVLVAILLKFHTFVSSFIHFLCVSRVKPGL